MTKTPLVCGGCGVAGCKLWRHVHAVPNILLCAVCAQQQEEAVGHCGPQSDFIKGTGDCIGHLVPAVRGADGLYWGYCHTPQDAIKQWHSLAI